MAARTIPIHPAPGPAFEYLTTKKDELVGWARKFSLFPYPFVAVLPGWVIGRLRAVCVTACVTVSVAGQQSAGIARISRLT